MLVFHRAQADIKTIMNTMAGTMNLVGDLAEREVFFVIQPN
jgi:hypothetical protein